MTNNPFTPAQRQALIELRQAWSERRIVLIGASALACQIEMRWRRTNDIDLTIVAEQEKLTSGLGSQAGFELATTGFEGHSNLQWQCAANR